jgi:hypothetical protein
LIELPLSRLNCTRTDHSVCRITLPAYYTAQLQYRDRLPHRGRATTTSTSRHPPLLFLSLRPLDRAFKSTLPSTSLIDNPIHIAQGYVHRRPVLASQVRQLAGPDPQHVRDSQLHHLISLRSVFRFCFCFQSNPSRALPHDSTICGPIGTACLLWNLLIASAAFCKTSLSCLRHDSTIRGTIGTAFLRPLLIMNGTSEVQLKFHTCSHHSIDTCRTQACPSKRWHRTAITNLDNPQNHALGNSATIFGGCGRQHTLSLAPYCSRLQQIRSLGLSATGSCDFHNLSLAPYCSRLSADPFNRPFRDNYTSTKTCCFQSFYTLQLRLVVPKPLPSRALPHDSRLSADPFTALLRQVSRLHRTAHDNRRISNLSATITGSCGSPQPHTRSNFIAAHWHVNCDVSINPNWNHNARHDYTRIPHSLSISCNHPRRLRSPYTSTLSISLLHQLLSTITCHNHMLGPCMTGSRPASSRRRSPRFCFELKHKSRATLPRSTERYTSTALQVCIRPAPWEISIEVAACKI